MWRRLSVCCVPTHRDVPLQTKVGASEKSVEMSLDAAGKSACATGGRWVYHMYDSNIWVFHR
jgi:hypothetical protein